MGLLYSSPVPLLLGLSCRPVKGSARAPLSSGKVMQDHLWLWGKTVLPVGPCCSKFPFFHIGPLPFCVCSLGPLSFYVCHWKSLLLFGFGLWVYCKLCLEQTDSLLPGKELLLRLPDTIQPSHCLLPFSATCRRWSSIWAHLLQVGLLPVPALEKDSVTSCSERSALQPLDLAGLSGWRHWQ